MNRVLLCGDFLMTRKITQEYHLKWFSCIVLNALRNTIKEQTVELFVSDSSEEASFDRKKFFDKSDIEVDLSSTHFYFSPDNISKDSLEYLKKFLDGALIIGYELSKETRQLLDSLSIVYIDIWLHPIRFLDDNFYAFYSNSEEINSKLSMHHLDSEHYYLYANKLKIQSYMGWNKYAQRLQKNICENSAVFIGQTLTDKAVCNNGKMLNILDFKSEFSDLCNRYDRVYFSRHPMLKGGDDEQLEFIKTFGNVVLTDIPAYQLLCLDQIKHVVAISSSVVLESKYFGKSSEYYYEPVISIYDENLTENIGYFSAYNKLHSNVFWFEILEHILALKVKPTRDIDFIDGISTYRDMLSLYYNNGVFDKQHYTFNKIESINKMVPSAKKAAKKENVFEYLPNKLNFERIIKEIDRYDAVSFDVFDTLLQRKCYKPSDVIGILAAKVHLEFSIDRDEFIQARISAKKYFDLEEVPLLERYTKVTQLLNLAPEMSEVLYNMELDVERVLLEPKIIGLELFKYAKSKKKKILIISDTYFTKEFIIEILSKYGMDATSYYISSDLNKTKEKGSLYSYIKQIDSRFIHIGDNLNSDYDQAKSKGIQGILIPSNFSFYRKSGSKLALDASHFMNSVHYGLLQNTLTKYPAITNGFGYTKGDAYYLGYNIFGRVMLSFSAWIISYAQKNKIKDLYFLARDGEIIKKSVDILLKKLNINYIETHYLLASRRAVRVASLDNTEQLHEEISSFIKDVSSSQKKVDLREYLSLRFGLNKEILEQLDGSDKLEEWSQDFDFLSKWLKSPHVSEAIFANAKKEREIYLNYLNSMGLNSNSANVAFIDIGHSGSLQCSLVNMLGLSHTHGLYFATYSDIDEKLGKLEGQHHSRGYYRNSFDKTNRDDFYIKNALIIEALFLNDKTTFMHFNHAISNDFNPVYLGKDQKDRLIFNRKIHRGVEAYITDYITVILEITPQVTASSFVLDMNDICLDLKEYLENPSSKDVEVFEGVSLENYFAARPIRYYIPPKDSVLTLDSVRGSLWRKGTEFYYKKQIDALKRNESLNRKQQSNFFALEKKVVGFFLKKSSRKREKYLRDSGSFFKDSNSSVVRVYYFFRKYFI